MNENISIKDTVILDHIEKIVEVSRKYGIDKCIPKGKKHLDYVTKKLGITPLQAVIFSQFMERSNDNYIQISEIADSLKCSTVRIIKYMNECEELERKKLIRCSRNKDGISYRVPRNVCEALRRNKEFSPDKNENISVFKFFNVLEQIFEERSNNELTHDALQMELLDLIKLNMHLDFCKKIMSYKFCEYDLVLLVCFCHLFGNNNDDNIRSHDIDFIYEDKIDFRRIEKGLAEGTHTLIEEKFVEHNNDEGFCDSGSWKLSDKAKKELLVELNLKRKHYKKSLTLFEKINKKEMFYNERETKEIQTLTSLLHEENFCKVQQRLGDKGMRKGFACLFSGSPGTGKTETVYQLARETKRNIMLVDISETKSMWFGESEKKIKEVFETYRTAVENSETAPILLFNEADAVIGKRKKFTSSNNRSIDQTENTIQNIILQEMENLSGILIATTNLMQNMDSAFERRFLYKITFDKPSKDSRKGIWNAMLPDLPEENALELAEKFELSGGQIENIARKVEVDAILNGERLSVDTLTQYCKDEIQNGFNSDSTAKIGF